MNKRKARSAANKGRRKKAHGAVAKYKKYRLHGVH